MTRCSLPPKVDKFILDFLGKKFPREHDASLTKLQTVVLAIARPLSSAWLQLVEKGQEEEPNMLLPASEVMMLIQCSLCLVGNASELISQTRRVKILEQIDRSWSKYGTDPFPSPQGTLFGDEFQETLIKKVEKDLAFYPKQPPSPGEILAIGEPATQVRMIGERTSFFEGALLPGTETGRAGVFSRTTHHDQRTILPGAAPTTATATSNRVRALPISWQGHTPYTFPPFVLTP